MRKITYSVLGILSLALLTVSCEKNDKESTDSKSIYKILNNGTAGVMEITDTNDSEGLTVAQAIPSVSGETYPANMPILFFFDDKILVPTITAENLIVTENEKKVKGTVSITEQANGYAILSFIPEKQFAANSSIKIILTTDLQDDAGLGNNQDFVIEYMTSSANDTSFTNNSGFENGTNGVTFVGDGSVLVGDQGCVSPFGTSFAGITSGTQLISSDSAIGDATSLMILGPINSNVSSISFKYNFLSAEFQEYVGSQFDDSFVAVVVGQNGAYSEFITSVNTLGTAGNTACNSFPGMPDNGDSYFGTTGWQNKQMSFPNMGNDTYIIFIVTDVSDTIYSSIVCIDDVTVN